jgi:hypothetical protein
LNQVHPTDGKILEFACLIADVEAVFVGTVRTINSCLHWDSVLLAISDHLLASGKGGSEFWIPPGGDYLHCGFQRLGSQLKSALIVPFACGTVGEGIGSYLSADLKTLFCNERPGNRGSH